VPRTAGAKPEKIMSANIETKIAVLKQEIENRNEAIRTGHIVENYALHMHNEHGDAVAAHVRKMSKIHLKHIEKMEDAIDDAENGDATALDEIYETLEDHAG
jgi:molecular chaperone GrpE (heat shock protein)